MLVTVIIGKQVFTVDDGYMDEPTDNLYPLYNSEGEEIGRVEGGVLQNIAKQVPACYSERYLQVMSEAVDKAFDSIKINTVLRLVVNSNNYINYVISPIMLSDIANREGGSYFAFLTDKNDNHILYAGNTAVELIQNIRFDIRACDANVHVIDDSYFQKAIHELLEMHKLNDVCVKPYLYATFKDPESTIAKPGEEEACHDMHCQWCQEMGLDGKHGNWWSTDGNTYVEPECKTTHSHYGRVKGYCK